MGEELTIKGTQVKVKVRSPIWVLVWTLLTVGIYFFFWYYFINRELADYGKSKKTDDCGEQPSTSLLAMLLGWIIIVPPFVSIFNCFRRVDAAVQLSKTDVRGVAVDPVLGLIVFIVLAPAVPVLVQLNLNRIWEKAAK